MIEIQIRSHTHSGKSSLLRFIKECLEKADFKVEVKTPSDILEKPEEFYKRCLHSIQGTISLAEFQANRVSNISLSPQDTFIKCGQINL